MYADKEENAIEINNGTHVQLRSIDRYASPAYNE